MIADRPPGGSCNMVGPVLSALMRRRLSGSRPKTAHDSPKRPTTAQGSMSMPFWKARLGFGPPSLPPLPLNLSRSYISKGI